MELTRTIISQVRSKLGLVKPDDRLINNKVIYQTLINYSDILIKRDSDSRKIFNNPSMIVLSDCFELEEINPKDNCLSIIIPKCNSLRKSVERLPEFYISGYQLPLLQISSIDDSTIFVPTTQYLYIQSLNREFRGKQRYYWVEDGYLVFANEDLEAVKVKGYFKDYHKPTESSSCKTKLDTVFAVPSYLISDIIRLTVEDLSIRKKIVEDENTNLNNNIKQ